jgi:hypothetical protein
MKEKKLKIIHDKKGETLTIYFDRPSKNQICEEVGDGVILIKDKKSKKVIGFEKLYFKSKLNNIINLQ